MRKRSATGGAYHWQTYSISDLLPAAATAKEVLLFGCGDAGERLNLHELGFETVAFDIARSSGADFLADGHCLPVQDASFNMVLSMQVLEHLHAPWEAAQEIARVLEPGGWFIGSVAFLKPYHNSYFHMSHKGITHLLATNGLTVDTLVGAQSLTYTIYGSLAPLGTRAISRFVYGGVDRLLSGLRAKVYSLGRGIDPDQPTDRFDEDIPLSFRAFEKLRFAPAVVFRAQKITKSD